ncbi:hypothetical protein EPUS_03703 [Endocarpon pusillum Z07020]|uniref:Chromosome segregation in meiosis protein n=1 Tax=Endocarpon pusillum (strain Z07020 / HMAS-L-300199) TaxID=1263415 RepID=U1GDD9_ENDPU|nr:uncharacterized protein EPUS_03703 [Endocarpon pusillum Z07020]ERF69711.1 hypothetical protein EPUS_03703 [Endocarpon pusillum Z07020]
MAADTTTRNTVTSLLNYDVSDNDDDPFREIDTTLYDPTNKSNGTKRKATGTDNKENTDLLGLDEEVKIVKKRKPVAKLDEARLLSQPGIPKLRALARSGSIASKLRLKGKGHEYSDAAKLLGYYQLWLDNLYPKAKFADGLQLVEKVGHGKMMQAMRKEWIDEGKPGHGTGVEDRQTSGTDGKQNAMERTAGAEHYQSSDKKLQTTSKHNTQDSIFGDLEEGGEDDLFFNDPKIRTTTQDDEVNEPDEDELDALLAEQSQTRDSQPHQQQQQQQHASTADEDDDLDALMAEQPVWNMPGQGPTEMQQQNGSPPGDDELDALLAENEITQQPQAEKTLHGRGTRPIEEY